MNEPLRPWKTEVLLPLALVLLLLAPPAASREQASSDPDPSPALSPKIETRILQRNETLLQSEVRVLPGGDPGRVLWTRIDVSDSKGKRVRSKIFGGGIGAQAYSIRLSDPLFCETYRITVESVVKPPALGAEQRISRETDVIILDDDLAPPAIVIDPNDPLERPDSWDTGFQWSVTDPSGLHDVKVSLFRNGSREELSGDPEGSYLPVHPGTYRLEVRAEDGDDDRWEDRMKGEKLSPVMTVFDDDDHPPVLDIRFSKRTPEKEPFLAVDLLASDPSGIGDIQLLHEGEVYRPPPGEVYARGDVAGSYPLTFQLLETTRRGTGTFGPWAHDPREGGFRISVEDDRTDGPAGFRFTLLSDPVTLKAPTASEAGHPGEAPYFSSQLSGVFLDLEVQAVESYEALLSWQGAETEDREGRNRVGVFYRINRGSWVDAFRVEGNGQNPFLPCSVSLPALPSDEVQVKVVYEGEINAFFSREYKEARIARAAVQAGFSWEVVEHEPVLLPVPLSAGVHTFTVTATDGDEDREGDPSSTEEVFSFTVPAAGPSVSSFP